MSENRKDFSVRMTVEDTAAQSASITDYFIVSIGHQCSQNELEFTSVTSSLPNYEIPSSGTGASEQVTFAGHDAASTVGLSTSDCPLTCNLQIYNEVSNEWETYGDITTDYVDSYDDTSDCSWNLLTPASIGSTYSGSGSDPDIIYLRY